MFVRITSFIQETKQIEQMLKSYTRWKYLFGKTISGKNSKIFKPL